MHITTMSFGGNPNVGLYAFCTDRFCLVGSEVPEDKRRVLSKILKVPVYEISIAGTSLIGVFIAGNEQVVLVPEIAFEHELEALRNLGIDVSVIHGKLTALGNNILATESGCLISQEFEEEAKEEIGSALGVPVKAGLLGGVPTVGSVAVASRRGVLISSSAEDFEVEFVETLLKRKCTRGTVNGGSSYIKSALIINSHGIVAGSHSTGIELDNADKAFGFAAAE